MKTFLWVAGLVLALQNVVPQSPVIVDLQIPEVTPSCVPTEPMPVLGLDSTAMQRYRMPVIRPNGLAPMPVLRLIPCYQLESSSRIQWPRILQRR
jgi:hypothetical protein